MVIAILAALAVSVVTPVPPPALVPLPKSVERRTGSFQLRATTVLVAPKEARRTAELLQEALRAPTGLPLPIQTGEAAGPRPDRIVLRIAPGQSPSGPESYRLLVSPESVEITASSPAGLFYGTQTLRQLLPAAAFRRASQDDAVWTLPAVFITDTPRFSWRGSHLDVARHFMPFSFVLRHLDLMAMHKLNVFHWHLTDDQGWRVPIEGYPRLTEIGGVRAETQVGKDADRGDGVRHQGSYTEQEIRDVVRYAADRFITVVPEIELPGHSQAAVAAYPELGNSTSLVTTWTRWGVSDNVLNTEEGTVRFFEQVLRKVMQLFPSPWIHIGGDEVQRKEWEQSPRVNARIEELGLSGVGGVQGWWTRRITRFLDANGRRPIGWEEVLEAEGIPASTVAVSWRGEAGGLNAARAGHDVVMAPANFTYLDQYQSQAPGEPLAIGGFLPLEKIYSYEPVPPGLTEREATHILGAQAQLWTEYLPTPRHVEYMAWPRLAALAEVVWSPRADRSWQSFLARIGPHAERLRAFGVEPGPLPPLVAPAP